MIAVLFFILFGLLVIRLAQIQIFQHHFFLEKSLAQRLRVVTLSPNRGNIYDRNGHVLALSIRTESVYVDPRHVTRVALQGLARLLELQADTLFQEVATYHTRSFLWVKRKVPLAIAAEIRKQGWPGVGLLPEQQRVYPKGKLAAHVLGFVGIDNQGLSGIELAFDQVLKGQEGKLRMESDPSGKAIFLDRAHFLSHPTDGVEVTLTLDEVIQYRAEQLLAATLKKHHAHVGSVIVMDVTTGELYALASRPTFDPNRYDDFSPDSWVSHAVGRLYEPGSTFKVVTVAAGLDQGIIYPETTFYCPDSIQLGGRTIRNSHGIWGKTRNVSITEILSQSLNTGVVQIGLRLGPERFMKYIRGFGFGVPTGIELPGELAGLVKPISTWDKPDIGMMTFGQSIAVTPLQLITALAAVGNEGILVKPHLVKKVENREQQYESAQLKQAVRRVIQKKTARELLIMMEKVTKGGTGKDGDMKTYRVASKTGTAEKISPRGGYLKGHYIASFLGIVPADRPRLAVLVVVDDPGGVYWGGYVAGPTFREVAQTALERLGVSPRL